MIQIIDPMESADPADQREQRDCKGALFLQDHTCLSRLQSLLENALPSLMTRTPPPWCGPDMSQLIVTTPQNLKIWGFLVSLIFTCTDVNHLLKFSHKTTIHKLHSKQMITLCFISDICTIMSHVVLVMPVPIGGKPH